MRPWLTAVVQDVGIGAASVFQGIGKDWHVHEATVGVDALSELDNGAIVPNKPSGVEGDRVEGVPENVTGNISLTPSLCFVDFLV
jgi:hypothetical protein